MSGSYLKISFGCEVSVLPEFLEEQSLPDNHQFMWRYTVTIKNTNSEPLQLVERHWIIINERGERTEIQGAGVTGEQPIIRPGETYSYISGCPLNTPSGVMHGDYKMIGLDGQSCNIEIPVFSLDSPYANIILN